MTSCRHCGQKEGHADDCRLRDMTCGRVGG